MAKVNIDVMVNKGQRFYRTLRYEYNPLFKVNKEDLVKWVLQKCPLLKYEKGVEIIVYDHAEVRHSRV